jgi:hypothetical protein
VRLSTSSPFTNGIKGCGPRRNQWTKLEYKRAMLHWTYPASVKVAERMVVAAVFSVLSEELSCSVDAGPVIAKNIRKDMGAITSLKEGEERKSAGTKERVNHVDRVQVCHQVAAVRNRGRTCQIIELLGMIHSKWDRAHGTVEYSYRYWNELYEVYR